MSQAITAVFENGVLRPLQPLNLKQHEQVSIRIQRNGEPNTDDDEDWIDYEYAEHCAAEADDSITLEQVRKELSTIKGSLDDAIDEIRGEY